MAGVTLERKEKRRRKVEKGVGCFSESGWDRRLESSPLGGGLRCFGIASSEQYLKLVGEQFLAH